MIQTEQNNITFNQLSNDGQIINSDQKYIVEKPKSKVKAVLIATILLLILIITLYFLPKTIVIFSRASSIPTNYSLDNSYLFASPIQAKANNVDKVRVTVFILDSRGLGVSNRQVSLNLSEEINNQHVQAITDSNGKAIFDLSSPKVGSYEVSALTDNEKIPQKVKIVFY